jgi:Short C-terminal domain
MKASQLERLLQLGDLREKGLLTDEEFAEQKAAVMGSSSEAPEPGRRTRWIGRVVVLLSLAVAGVALYFALDARDRAKSEADAVRSQIVTAHPKLVIDEATEEASVPADGYSHNIEAGCPPHSFVVGGGWPSGLSRALPTIDRDFPSVGVWLVGASTEGKGLHLSVDARCVHGEGGLIVEGPTP